MQISEPETKLYEAISELSSTLALRKGGLTEGQEDKLRTWLSELLGEGRWLDKVSFDPDTSFSLEAQYRVTLKTIESNKFALDRVLIRKFLYVLERVSQKLGISEHRREVIDRLEQDLIRIHARRGKEEDLKMSPELSNLYSTIGQLAYVIALADHVITEDEKQAFRRVIKENLGNFDWLAKERFKVIEQLMVTDVESNYEHALFLIEKNRQALTEEIISKFMNVIIEVASVAGISPEEEAIIERFRKDIYQIYHA